MGVSLDMRVEQDGTQFSGFEGGSGVIYRWHVVDLWFFQAQEPGKGNSPYVREAHLKHDVVSMERLVFQITSLHALAM